MEAVGNRRVAALYVDPKGVYAGLPDVDVWDEQRDARLYDGPYPVVAHPPCNRWLRMASVHGRIGDDGGTFAAAMNAVHTWGGVLEHPAFSYAWKWYGLPKPGPYGWRTDLHGTGWSTEVDQYAYGFLTSKPTWLYSVGVTLPSLAWGDTGPSGVCTTFGEGWPNQRGQRSAIPPAFRDVLLTMARSAARVPAGFEVPHTERAAPE